MNVRDDDVLLMLLPKTQQVFAVAGIALNATQNSNKHLDDLLGGYLISSCGDVFRIKSAQKCGLFGDGFISKLKSAVFGMYSLQVELGREEIEFSALSKLIHEYMERELSQNYSCFEFAQKNKSTTLELIKNSTSVNQIFNSINMPKVTDCLDML